jgi:hypothetical protein
MNLISYDRHLIIVKGKAAWMQASSELEGMVWASVRLALLGMMLVARQVLYHLKLFVVVLLLVIF